MNANKKTNKSNPFFKKPAAGAVAPHEAHHGLGKGLGALIGSVSKPLAVAAPAVPPAAEPKNAVLEVPPLDIERSPWQPRQDFNEDALKELSESIKSNGVIQPLVCRRNAAGKYELIAGERRLRASVMAGFKRVPVVLVDAEDRKAAEMAVIENIQRRDLNVIEEAEGYKLLAEKFNLTQESVAERVGKSRPGVANALRLLELPDEVKQLVSQNLLSPGHAKVLLGVEDEKERVLLARDCVNDGLSVRALEIKIARRHKPVTEKKAGTPDLPESYVRNLMETLHRQLGCAVRVTSGVTHANGKHTKGLLEIDFFDNDDLDRILSQLGVKLD